MSAAACAAKIKADGGRFMRTAKLVMGQISQDMDDALARFAIRKGGDGELTDAEMKALEALSQKWCDWADVNVKWADTSFKESRGILAAGYEAPTS